MTLDHNTVLAVESQLFLWEKCTSDWRIWRKEYFVLFVKFSNQKDIFPSKIIEIQQPIQYCDLKSFLPPLLFCTVWCQDFGYGYVHFLLLFTSLLSLHFTSLHFSLFSSLQFSSPINSLFVFLIIFPYLSNLQLYLLFIS